MTCLTECLWHWHKVALIMAIKQTKRNMSSSENNSYFGKQWCITRVSWPVHIRMVKSILAEPGCRQVAGALESMRPRTMCHIRSLTAAINTEQVPVWAQSWLWCWPFWMTSFSSWAFPFLPPHPPTQTWLHIFLLLEPNQTRLYK